MDWNEDGLKDLLVGENNGQVRYFQNVGSVGNPVLHYVGLIQVSGVTLDVGDYSQPFVNDWNEDAKKDLIVGASDGRAWLYINEGTNASPVFRTISYIMLASGAQLDVGDRCGAIVVDLDGDGVKDVVSGEINGKIKFFKNNGTNANPQLAASVFLMTGTVQASTPGTSRLDVVRWDNNLTYDLVVGSYDSRLRLFKQAATNAPAPTITLTRTSGYIVPGSGGTISYTIAINNPNPSTVTFDLWTDLQLPNYGYNPPMIQRTGVQLTTGASASRNLNINVPGSWAAGMYYYYGYVGSLSTFQLYNSSNFYFYKNTTGDGAWVGEWSFDGWTEEPAMETLVPLPLDARLAAAPNPFNPTTNLSYDLPDAGTVYLAIFNTSGQKVVELANGYRTAGNYQVTWDAGSLPSGVYFARLNTGTQQVVQKLLLTK
ncbi:MAG: FG-GAP-like repeat-containing protein [bacterium]|nr:FG-GAP-like repeat-containing protein [bacterium]